MNNPDIPEMYATDTSGLGTRTVIQGGREASYLIRSYAKGPRAYVTGPMEQLGVGVLRTPLLRPVTRAVSSKVELPSFALAVTGSNPVSPTISCQASAANTFSAKHEARG